MIRKMTGCRWVSTVVVALVALMGSATLRADGSEGGKITNIIVEGSALVSVFLDGVDYTAECSGGNRWTLLTSDPLFKEKYSALVAAAAAGQTVWLYKVTSSGCGPMNGNPIYYVNALYP